MFDVVCAGTTGTGGGAVVTTLARIGAGAAIVTGTVAVVVGALAGIEVGAGAGVARAEAIAEKSNADVTVGGAITEMGTGIGAAVTTGVGDVTITLAGINVGAAVGTVTAVLAGVRIGVGATAGAATTADAGVANPLAIEAKSNIGRSGNGTAGADGTAVFITADTQVATSEIPTSPITGNFDI